MIDVLNLALPFFGLIFIGFACGRIKQIPDTALAWMDFFIVYVALPALFYRILAQTPLEKLSQVDFIFATTLATFWAFSISFAIGMVMRKGNIAESTIAGLAGGYGNIGYMGPGLALATLGQQAAVPVALIFCFDTLLLFTLVPFIDGARHAAAESVAKRGSRCGQAHCGPPAGDCDRARRDLGGRSFPAAARARAADAVPAERGGALRAVRARRDGGAAAAQENAVGGAAARRREARAVHPVLVFLLLSLFGPFDQVWVDTAVLMAALPPALNVFVFARQYDAWVEQASSAVLVGTLVSVATLTSVMWMVKSGALPALLFR